MEFRFLSAADAVPYWQLRLESLEIEPQAFGASAEEHRTLPIGEAATRISFDPSEKFVVGAFDDGGLIGTAGFFRGKGRKEKHKGHIWGVYLARPARGKGIAQEMMRILLDQAAKIDGIEQIVLSVAAGQSAATNLYRSLGFETFGLEKNALKVGDHYIDEEHMVLFLKRIS